MKVLLHTLMTEKSMDKTDKENKLVFIVNENANKNEIRREVEKTFAVKVTSVNTLITMRGQKKAIVQLSKEHSAADIVSKMGVL